MNIKLNKSIMIQIVFLCPHLYQKIPSDAITFTTVTNSVCIIVDISSNTGLLHSFAK